MHFLIDHGILRTNYKHETNKECNKTIRWRWETWESDALEHFQAFYFLILRQLTTFSGFTQILVVCWVKQPCKQRSRLVNRKIQIQQRLIKVLPLHLWARHLTFELAFMTLFIRCKQHRVNWALNISSLISVHTGPIWKLLHRHLISHAIGYLFW